MKAYKKAPGGGTMTTSGTSSRGGDFMSFQELAAQPLQPQTPHDVNPAPVISSRQAVHDDSDGTSDDTSSAPETAKNPYVSAIPSST